MIAPIVSLRFAAPAGALCYRLAEVLGTRTAADQLVVRVLPTGRVLHVSTRSVAEATEDAPDHNHEGGQHAAL